MQRRGEKERCRDGKARNQFAHDYHLPGKVGCWLPNDFSDDLIVVKETEKGQETWNISH